jgi:hypothetical protein
MGLVRVVYAIWGFVDVVHGFECGNVLFEVLVL